MTPKTEELWQLAAERVERLLLEEGSETGIRGVLVAWREGRGPEGHAGVGVIREYGLTLHTQRSRTLYHLLGEPRYHRRRLADALGW